MGEVDIWGPKENVVLYRDGFIGTFREGTTYQGKLNTLVSLLAVEERTPFVVGDLLLSLVERHGEKAYDDLSEATGYAVGTLKNKVRISMQIPPENRREGVKPWLWQEIAPIQDPDEQASYIDRAYAGEFKNRDDVRTARRNDEEGGKAETPPVTRCPTCNSLVPEDHIRRTA